LKFYVYKDSEIAALRGIILFLRHVDFFKQTIDEFITLVKFGIELVNFGSDGEKQNLKTVLDNLNGAQSCLTGLHKKCDNYECILSVCNAFIFLGKLTNNNRFIMYKKPTNENDGPGIVESLKKIQVKVSNYILNRKLIGNVFLKDIVELITKFIEIKHMKVFKDLKLYELLIVAEK
ncbi:hypothetical protein EDEG_04232, partial [Edhazardia aedis USNM 41457]